VRSAVTFGGLGAGEFRRLVASRLLPTAIAGVSLGRRIRSPSTDSHGVSRSYLVRGSKVEVDRGFRDGGKRDSGTDWRETRSDRGDIMFSVQEISPLFFALRASLDECQVRTHKMR
jgi:hypothetical protein